jgi:hypothetical protein
LGAESAAKGTGTAARIGGESVARTDAGCAAVAALEVPVFFNGAVALPLFVVVGVAVAVLLD